MLSGPLGGDTQIGARVAVGDVAAVVFLIDPLYAQPHEPDIRALLRVCEVHNVPLATNIATAEAVITHLGKARVAHLIFNPVAGQSNPNNDLALIRRTLEPQVQLNVIFTEADKSPADQAREVLEAGTDLVIASGGDGTVSMVAGVVMETDIPLGGDSQGHSERIFRCPGYSHHHSGSLRNDSGRKYQSGRCRSL